MQTIKYFVKVTKQDGSIAYLSTDKGRMAWSHSHCMKLIRECKAMEHYENCDFSLEME